MIEAIQSPDSYDELFIIIIVVAAIWFTSLGISWKYDASVIPVLTIIIVSIIALALLVTYHYNPMMEEYKNAVNEQIDTVNCQELIELYDLYGSMRKQQIIDEIILRCVNHNDAIEFARNELR